MTVEFIQKNMFQAVYEKKEGTATSYYWRTGSRLFPNRVSVERKGEITKVCKKGRNLQDPIAGQLVASFTAREDSPYKRYKPYVFRTQIWSKSDYPLLIGYGTVGITNADGVVEDTGDLLVLASVDDWCTIQIYLFKAMGNPNDVAECMLYINDIIRESNK